MKIDNQIILTLYVPSIEATTAWYERVLGWKGHFDTFNEAGQCLFGSVLLRDNPPLGFNLSRSTEKEGKDPCTHVSGWIYVENVDAIYQRVLEQGWPVEQALENQFWGERTFQLRDCNGIHLIISQPVEDINLEEIRERHRKNLDEGRAGTE